MSSNRKPGKAPTKPLKKAASAPRKTVLPKKISQPDPPAKKPQATKKTVTAKKTDKAPASKSTVKSAPVDALEVEIEIEETVTVVKAVAPVKAKAVKTTLDDLALDIEEKDELVEEEKKDLVKVLREDEDEPLETAFVPTDTSERYILVVDEEGQRRNETMTIVSQILPNAVVEVADDPEEALEIMHEADFDTYVVNFLMPGYSASPFVKAVANHPDHPLLIGFAADKISDALDQKKGLKIIPLKRLFDLDVNAEAKDKAEKEE
jgi:PleD family two-component response regulator